MATTPGYDPKKAALFNQLRQGGLSEDEASIQAGITDAETENYAVGKNGQLGSFVDNSVLAFTAAQIEQNKLNRQFQPVDYDQTPTGNPAQQPSKKSTTYTTTSTTEVSGGGTVNTVDGELQATPASRALQPAIDAKQAEIEQFNRDNPSNFARKKLGLPSLTQEEFQKRNEQQLALVKEKQALRQEQESAQVLGPPSITTTPNTTTTNTTVITGVRSVDTAVQSPGGSDPAINQQTEENLGVAVGASNVQTAPGAVENNESVSTPPPAVVPNPSVTDPPPAVDPNSSAVITPGTGTDGVANVNITGSPANVNPNDDPNTNVGSDGPSQAELIQNQNAQAVASDPNTNVGIETADPNFAANPDEEAERDNLNAAIKQGTLDKARAQNTIANQRRNPNNGDWRVKLRLAPGSNYLYNAPGGSGILQPVAAQGGVIFPYTPTIQTTYKATYSSYDLTHSNYKGYYYQGSQVEPVTLSCPFTAQSTVEAEYLLAVIHFFKSVTKMFYGQDPERGTPPPLVYLTGLGEFQFNEHPCVVQSFTYDLPADVDYIRARSPNVNNSNMLNKRQSNNATGPGTTWGNGVLGNFLGGAINRLANAGLPKGGMNKPPAPQSFGQNSPTYVPTKMTIAIYHCCRFKAVNNKASSSV